MKLFIVMAGLTCWSLIACAQITIKGHVTDGKEYLPSVNVVLQQDTIMVKSAVSEKDGSFSILNVTAGVYRIKLSMIGYWPYDSTLVIGNSHGVIAMANIILKEANYELGEVTIESRRQNLHQQMDRLVIRPAENISSSGNTVLEVLQKSPGVIVNKQTNSISINGRSGARIMINDKIIPVSGDVALQMLDGMNASQIDEIELITSPPSNYDADGGAGIIRIVSNNNSAYGTNGSLTLTGGAHWAETLGVGGNVHHRTRKFAYFIDGSMFRNHNRHNVNLISELTVAGSRQRETDQSRRENVTTQYNLSGGGEWNIFKNTMINVLIAGYRKAWMMDAITYNARYTNNDLTPLTATHVHEDNIWQSASASIGIQRQLNIRRKLDVTLDYLFYHNHNPSDYRTIASNPSIIDLSKATPIHFIVGSANYKSTDNGMFTWDTGAKIVASTLNNNVLVRRMQGNEWIVDHEFTSDALQLERILAAYVSSSWKPGNGIEINTGLRFEYTWTVIRSSEQPTISRKYAFLFPNISIRKQIDEVNELNVSYTRRITRPTYNDIAPYVFFWGPNSFSAGNTTLFAALSDAVSATYRHHQLALSLTYSHTDNEIAMMQPEIIRESGSLVLRSQNLSYLKTIAINTSYSTQLTSWWEVQTAIAAQYQVAKAKELQFSTRQSRYGLNANVSHTIKLPKGFACDLSAMYQSRSLSGVSQFLAYGSLNAGVQKSVGKSGSLKLAVDDILDTNRWRIRTKTSENDLLLHFDYNFNNRFVRLTYTWTPGNKKLQSVNLKAVPMRKEKG